MEDCAKLIQRITNDLMDLSRVDRAEDYDVEPGVGLRAAVRLARVRVTSGDVQIGVHVDDRTSLRGRGGDLNQVFLNIIESAARAVGASGRIEVHGTAEDGAYVVRVEDSGPGVAPEMAAHVFEAFWTSRPAGEGTGLGLAIAKEVVEQHGGSIAVGRSALGGASFEVRLPLHATTQESPAPAGVPSTELGA
jgi:signal transduction histidine kinase